MLGEFLQRGSGDMDKALAVYKKTSIKGRKVNMVDSIV